MADVINSAFMVGNATVMIGQMSESVFDLLPETHSVGMVKNVRVGMESSQLELRNGVQGNLVDSVKSGVSLSLSFEGYEYSARNLQLALGIAGTPVQYRRGKLAAAASAAATTLSIASNPVTGDPASGITAAANIPNGATLLLTKPAPDNSFAYPVRTTATTTGAGPFSATISALPAGITFPADSPVWVVNELAVGDQAEQDYFNVKIVGTMSGGGAKPVVVIFPKVKIVKGFNLAFTEDGYSNLPFEVSPYFLTQSEVTGRLSEIGTKMQGKVYIGA